MGENEASRRGEMDWSGEPDLTDMGAEGLRGLLSELAVEERDLSYRRRVVQGRIDLIRSELVRRGEGALSAEDLARVMLGEQPEGGGV
jgi:hypothetical protein